MATNIKELKCHNDFDFEKQVNYLLNYIKKHWDVRAVPKGYKKFCENYTDFQGMEEMDWDKIMGEFEGFEDSSAVSYPFPGKVSLPHVAYDDINQGRKPLETLFGAIFSYGMRYGMRYEEVANGTNTYYRLSTIRHCIHMIELTKQDTEIQETYKKELEGLFNVREHYMDISKRFELIRDRIHKKRIIPVIISYFRYHFNRTKEPAIIIKTNHSRLREIWNTLMGWHCGRSKEHPVFTELKKELREKGIDVRRKKTTKSYEYIFIMKPCKKKVSKR